MDMRFLPAFENQARQLTSDRPFTWIRTMITALENSILLPQYRLRTDGIVFLLINIGYMIVLPWEYTETRDFRPGNWSLLEGDIERILAEAKNRASIRSEQEISANTLLEVVADLRDQMGTLNLKVWGTS